MGDSGVKITHTKGNGTADEPPRLAKQAVVVIHGMGEQIPMDTIKSFVKAVWEKDERITQNGLPYPTQVWSKPDLRTGSLELRRITTRESILSPPEYPGGVRTDFYELYWADLTGGTAWSALSAWVGGLLFRPWSRVPRDVRLAWVFLWVASIVVVTIGTLPLLPDDIWQLIAPQWAIKWKWAPTAIAGAFGVALHRMVLASFGRVVRYTRAGPDNIAAREAVRERGLKLLEALHKGSDYKRIVIVSHSLGTILALDLLNYFWSRREAARSIREGTPEFNALCELETAASHIDRTKHEPLLLKTYLEAQRTLRLLLAKRTAPVPATSSAPASDDERWLISDFVTLGSPLTHAEFLLAKDDSDLRERIVARELPKSPPFREDLDPKTLERAKRTGKLPISSTTKPTGLFSFPHPRIIDAWQMHHAAPFAVVRWSNIYDPSRFVFCGDVVGGPLAKNFGPAIIDVNLRDLRRRQSWSFTHTKYWAYDEKSPQVNLHVDALRTAVNLLDLP